MQRRKRLANILLCILFVFSGSLTWMYQQQYNHMKAMEQITQQDEQMWTALVDGIDSGIIVVSAADGKIREWNRGAERITGYHDHDMLGQQFIEIMPEAYRDSHLKHIYDPTVQAKLALTPLQLDCHIIDSRGEPVEVRVLVRATKNADLPLFLVTMDRASAIKQLKVDTTTQLRMQKRQAAFKPWSMN